MKEGAGISKRDVDIDHRSTDAMIPLHLNQARFGDAVADVLL